MKFEITPEIVNVLWIIVGVLIISIAIHVAYLIGDKFDNKENDDDDYEGFEY